MGGEGRKSKRLCMINCGGCEGDVGRWSERDGRVWECERVREGERGCVGVRERERLSEKDNRRMRM